MSNMFCRLGLAVALSGVIAVAAAAPRNDGQWHADGHSRNGQAKPAWQQHVEQQERQQRQQEHDQEWQRQQREEQRRQAEAQQRSNAAWQRQNAAWQRQQEAELRQRAADQRHRDAAWQRQQEAIQRRRAEQQRYDTGYRAPHGHKHRWQRGHRYTGPSYVVGNYGQYGLRTPPTGYRWVRADDDDDSNYLLVAVATGLILDIVTH